MRLMVAMGLAISLLCGAEAAHAEEKVEGTWKLIAGEADGKALSEQQLKDGKLVIQGKQYSATLHGMATITGEQRLDPTAKIKTIDITDSSGPQKGRTCLGIYELDGDLFRVTFAPPGKARPSKMSTEPHRGNWTHVWKRVTE